eukprot:GHUV01052838.1.p1 GENE.GHUV01052838.1~~GHUV01052838.1.p1  ORF type:complete len:115 (-),score=20.39 GHUV01052838.1:183-527(-)
MLGVGIHPVQAGLYFLAFSFCDGSPLCSSKPISPTLCAAVRAAVQRIHDRGMVHGDLRNDNILVQVGASSSGSIVTPCQSVVLLDLGSAHAAAARQCTAEMRWLEELLSTAISS